MSCGTHLHFEVRNSNMLEIFFTSDLNNVGGNYQNRPKPFANNQVFFTVVDTFEKLTQGDDVKTVYKLGLKPQRELDYEFQPGDSIGILPENDQDIIEKLLLRLNVEQSADTPCKLSSKKTLKHLPVESTFRQIFSSHVDINSPPKKLFLKSLINFTEDPVELAKLQKLSSSKHSDEYLDLIGGPGHTLLGLLDLFPSCRPPVATLLEHLPPLLPRFYSISSSPTLNGQLDITFFVLEHSDGRKGVCTGWLENLILHKRDIVVPCYFRQPTKFRLLQDLTVPLILVATGTGIAPFRGFLQHLSLLPGGSNSPKIWLFYGCRYPDRDFLYKDEILQYLKSGVLTKLEVAFSRDGVEKCYVQHQIEKHGQELVDWLLVQNAKLFVCGEVKTMVKGVKRALVNNLINYRGINELEAENCVKNMEDHGKFLIDTWV